MATDCEHGSWAYYCPVCARLDEERGVNEDRIATLETQLAEAEAKCAEFELTGFKLTGALVFKEAELATERAARVEAEAEREAMRERKDAAYLERNQVVAALAKCFPSGIARTAIEGWSDDWHGCVYIDLPTGQVSWHYHDSHAWMFYGLPAYSGVWDGHDTDEKYRRVRALREASGRGE